MKVVAKILAVLFILGGLLVGVLFLPGFLAGKSPDASAMPYIYYIAQSLVMIVTAIGLFRMKAWGLYAMGIDILLGFFENFYRYTSLNQSISSSSLVIAIIEITILVWFWSKRNQFSK